MLTRYGFGVNRPIKIPDSAEFRQRWQGLDRAGRKRVRRSVNRGQSCERRDEAALAVVVARQQKKAWLVTWPVVTVLVGLTAIGRGLVAVVATMALTLAVYAPFAVFFHRRANRAEERNREAVERRGSRKRR